MKCDALACSPCSRRLFASCLAPQDGECIECAGSPAYTLRLTTFGIVVIVVVGCALAIAAVHVYLLRRKRRAVPIDDVSVDFVQHVTAAAYRSALAGNGTPDVTKSAAATRRKLSYLEQFRNLKPTMTRKTTSGHATPMLSPGGAVSSPSGVHVNPIAARGAPLAASAAASPVVPRSAAVQAVGSTGAAAAAAGGSDGAVGAAATVSFSESGSGVAVAAPAGAGSAGGAAAGTTPAGITPGGGAAAAAAAAAAGGGEGSGLASAAPAAHPAPDSGRPSGTPSLVNSSDGEQHPRHGQRLSIHSIDDGAEAAGATTAAKVTVATTAPELDVRDRAVSLDYTVAMHASPLPSEPLREPVPHAWSGTISHVMMLRRCRNAFMTTQLCCRSTPPAAACDCDDALVSA